MIFHSPEVYIGLVLASIPAIISAYMFFIRKPGDSESIPLILLLLSAFLLRLVMISLDPYLHEWDERFHALVAKNMMDHPFRPMLFTKHIISYNQHDWAYMHIWVHKQPLFLWQMSASMSLFGVNTFALRLPSAIMGTILVFLTYDIGKKWILNRSVAYIAAFFTAFAYYALELISGHFSLEHNDVAFLFYVTCSFWAFTKYVDSGHKGNWIFLIGLFAGLAILNKWLVGLLVFGGWGLYLITSEFRTDLKKYLHVLTAVVVACIIFIPWQVYILKTFPAESAIAFEYNQKHMTEDLGHPGSIFFHLKFLPKAYHIILLILFAIGFYSLFKKPVVRKNLTFAFTSMIMVMFGFFSLLVKTKMPAFVYPVSSLIFIIMAYGLYQAIDWISNYLKIDRDRIPHLTFALILVIAGLAFKPSLIAGQRSANNDLRNKKINNTEVFKNIEPSVISDYVILNTRAYENIEFMFYKGGLAYHWYPKENVLDSLQLEGYKFAAFQYVNDEQALPGYIVSDSSVLILNDQLK